MEGEDSFEAIVAKAVYEVNRNQLLCLSGLKLLLALARFIAALEAMPKITASQPHGRVDLVPWRSVGFVAGYPGPRGTNASSRGKPPAHAKSSDGAPS